MKLDPCCGSGGMFIQSAALVKSKQGAIKRIKFAKSTTFKGNRGKKKFPGYSNGQGKDI